MTITHCRSCGSSSLHTVLDLGSHPVSNSLLTEEQFGEPEAKYPLAVALCQSCALLQVTETIPADVLYRRSYPYFSSASAALLKHSADHATALIERYQLGRDSLVMEIASNDGYMLRNFVQRGIPCLGIDPAEGPAKHATQIGVPTLNEFFGSGLATRLAREGKSADVIIANNVVAHVNDINDFVQGLARILAPTGVAVLEFAYAVDLIQNCEFDTIYHEHLFYHTLHGLQPLFGRHGLHVNDVERLPIHGGSLRLSISRGPERTTRLDALFRHEKDLGVDKLSFYQDFAGRVEDLRASLITLLKEEKAKGKRIACYGAAAKGATMVNYLDVGTGFFEYVVDANPFKQGKYLPGQRIPIRHPRQLLADLPDLVLLLVWNFAGEVLKQQSTYRERGGRFIVPVPAPRIVEPATSVEDTAYAIISDRSQGQIGFAYQSRR